MKQEQKVEIIDSERTIISIGKYQVDVILDSGVITCYIARNDEDKQVELQSCSYKIK